jgi:excisionase family DNA binding protein
MTDPRHLTTAQAARELGVSPSRVRQLVLAGRLRATKLGRDLLIDPRDLDAVRDRRPGRPAAHQPEAGPDVE